MERRSAWGTSGSLWLRKVPFSFIESGATNGFGHGARVGAGEEVVFHLRHVLVHTLYIVPYPIIIPMLDGVDAADIEIKRTDSVSHVSDGPTQIGQVKGNDWGEGHGG